MRLGATLRALREERSISRVELAKASKVSVRTIIYLEKNAHEPKLSTLLDILKALGVSLKDFSRMLER